MTYGKYKNTSSSPAEQCFLVTPHETNALSTTAKALRAGTAGTICFRPLNSSTDVTFTVVAGEYIPIFTTHVRVTGTTSTGIHGLA